VEKTTKCEGSRGWFRRASPQAPASSTFYVWVSDFRGSNDDGRHCPSLTSLLTRTELPHPYVPFNQMKLNDDQR
jgi:hypothetical protein